MVARSRNNDAMTTKRKNRIARIFNRPLAVRVHKIESSRAIYESQDVQRIDIRLTTDEGDKLTLELTDRHAFDLIRQLTTSYQAIHPSLPSSGYGQHWGMQ